jgi:hypothetical protein
LFVRGILLLGLLLLGLCLLSSALPALHSTNHDATCSTRSSSLAGVIICDFAYHGAYCHATRRSLNASVTLYSDSAFYFPGCFRLAA